MTTHRVGKIPSCILRFTWGCINTTRGDIFQCFLKHYVVHTICSSRDVLLHSVKCKNRLFSVLFISMAFFVAWHLTLSLSPLVIWKVEKSTKLSRCSLLCLSPFGFSLNWSKSFSRSHLFLLAKNMASHQFNRHHHFSWPGIINATAVTTSLRDAQCDASTRRKLQINVKKPQNNSRKKECFTKKPLIFHTCQNFF